MNMDLTSDNKWNDFAECFARRNIIVHNNGRVDKHYRSITNYDGDEYELTTDSDYVKKSIILFEKFGVMLMNQYASKFYKKQYD